MCLHRPKHHGENQRVQITRRMDNVSIHVWRPHVMTQRSQILAPRKKRNKDQPPENQITWSERMPPLHLYLFHSIWLTKFREPAPCSKSSYPLLFEKQGAFDMKPHDSFQDSCKHIRCLFCNAIFTWFTFPSLRLLKEREKTQKTEQDAMKLNTTTSKFRYVPHLVMSQSEQPQNP